MYYEQYSIQYPRKSQLYSINSLQLYPNVAVSEKNLRYAHILMPDFASAASEMTTVHQYLFQSWTISNDYQASGG